VNPDERARPGPGREPESQPRGEMQALALPKPKLDEIQGDDRGQSQPEQQGIQEIHGSSTILDIL
jgi:hypothetical protein